MLVITAPASAQQAPPASIQGTAPPAAATGKDQTWPKVLPQPDEKATSEAAQPWSKQEIELAQARCTALLKGLDVVALPDEPIREGAGCGTPAPMRLVSIGSAPQIAFSPPPLVNCDMIAALHKWLEREVQPLARRHLGAPLVRVATMSSYSCRNAYGRAKGRLSEHGKVNALDIAGFVTARGQAAFVIADWGPIAREIAAQAIAAQKQREAAEAAAKQRSNPPPPPQMEPAVAAQTPLRPSIPIELPGIAVQMPQPGSPAALGFAAPSRLGGPKQGDTPQPTPEAKSLTGEGQFLRAAHRAACGIFGTVLGPEANNAHKNHFHVDMAERRHGSICE
jgi:hypothetical protein